MKPPKTCPICGCALDAGESCDCTEETGKEDDDNDQSREAPGA